MFRPIFLELVVPLAGRQVVDHGAADDDVASFPSAELDVPDELGLLAKSHVRPDRDHTAVIPCIADWDRKERGNHSRPAVQVWRATRVIPGVVLVSVMNPVDAPCIHVDREDRIRVGF